MNEAEMMMKQSKQTSTILANRSVLRFHMPFTVVNALFSLFCIISLILRFEPVVAVANEIIAVTSATTVVSILWAMAMEETKAGCPLDGPWFFAFAYVLLVAVIFYGCSPEGSKNDVNIEKSYEVKVIDSCEYIYVSRRPWGGEFSLTHKGNCKFCAERSKK